jgi:large subunit ribosomal protein L35
MRWLPYFFLKSTSLSAIRIPRFTNFFKLGEIAVKQKTNKSAAKRFKVTGTGKILRRHSHARHILTKKSRKRVRKLVDSAVVSKSDTKRVKKMLNI